MKIYTKTGDEGFTSLYGGKRVPKSNDRIDAYGTIDELNSFIGLLRDQEISITHKNFLTQIQIELFSIGSILATPHNNQKKKLNIQKISIEEIEALENEIDHLDTSLNPMTHFILPGGHVTVSYCHVARSICRRAERLAYALHHHEPLEKEVLIYLNRLSDYLFVLARKLSKELTVEEIKWIPKKTNKEV
ncbi:cob(I)yrinic acid a,c-diamide adenosyltransferase [Aquimarina agarilytica]|uniref:cob(I)yrinic acid a,c-diamide adenosyltransferase n=1 Tax=Aquimarina agarilytica TaxID=1087449 RepID=UPI000287F15A|nr:cob(I)yrinic acid a,c-diamide adenosyltransferase [Aquimarina agarilytica]